MTSTFDLVYVCDAYPAIGMGHLMRGLSVLRELRLQFPELKVALTGRCSDTARSPLERWIPEGVICPDENASRWTSRVVVLDTMAKPGNPTALDTGRVLELKSRCGQLVLVSSAVEVQVTAEVDALIDHMPEVRIRGPQPSRCYLGLEYAPVAREFFDVEPFPPEDTRALVVVIGGSDRQTGPENLLEVLSSFDTVSFSALEMVVSPHYPHSKIEELRKKHTSWRFLQNVPSIAGYLARARAVVCTYGNVTYESLALARPTFVLGYRPFQEDYAQILESQGLVVNCGLFEAPRMEKLVGLNSPDLLSILHQRARETPIGCGANAIAQVLREEVASVQDS